MFLIENELGVVTTMMHKAAGCLELLYSFESLLSMPDKNENKKITLGAKSPVVFKEWKGT